jgi:hypothetical protein
VVRGGGVGGANPHSETLWEREERVARIVQKHPELEALSDRDELRDNSF